ncbi:5-carboxymethyl-2-hydroxymuconate Delta-isomerase [Psychrobacter sp. AOP22-C1-22]|uniref:5-carboxymethyl-2-hydroxymuconate Delta-isomerase n=1 Tax=unclassified Psychrobacter TaxID=196806 RepID=UPI001788149B|nr:MULTISPECIES: 5-carboxymethyl-2-hydroxymuconate Delta-isomerase [unclassified Psychrobacter]MBE0405650.1 5-carboxymethyl-2-hydroxymuconate Delta-isomerase [Psychrobacter sp. FME6]MBE0446185.1 5-carboxymethyl-2-hydroxymuconate Delta-isomerase [Psychrobacter sp. FME5]MDN5802738.1 5-carboxymethyl-2-hydroxymuconate Delta-isomerase [Psychrobacter sp.]
MPHLTIQVTPNVMIAHEESFIKALNKALWDSGHFGKPTDIKARIVPIETFLVGVEDDEQANGFVYAHLKIMSGRDLLIRNQLAELLVTTIEETIKSEQSVRVELQICVEVEEISMVYHKKMLS